MPFQLPPGTTQTEIRKENSERIIELLKWNLFIPLCSLVEYTTKSLLRMYSSHPSARKVVEKDKQNRSYRINLVQDIINPSVSHLLIDQDDAKAWLDLAKIRNIIIHNNGVAQSSGRIKLRDYLEINTKENVMIRVDLRFFYNASIEIIHLHDRWLRNLLDVYDQSPIEDEDYE